MKRDYLRQGGKIDVVAVQKAEAEIRRLRSQQVVADEDDLPELDELPGDDEEETVAILFKRGAV